MYFVIGLIYWNPIYSDLYALAGDWAAVGATASLLANSSGPGSSSEDQQIIQSMSQVSDLDDRRTQELDK